MESLVIHDAHSAQISQKQDEQNIYVIIENNVPSHLSPQRLCGNSCTTECPTVIHVHKCMSCHKPIVVIAGRAYCFYGNIFIYMVFILN